MMHIQYIQTCYHQTLIMLVERLNSLLILIFRWSNLMHYVNLRFACLLTYLLYRQIRLMLNCASVV